MKFRPCIDIHNGKVKQIVGGSLKDQGDYAKENFVSGQDAAFYAEYYRQLGLSGGHIILLNPVTSPYYEETRKQALLALQHSPGIWQIGGGITAENARNFLEAGAEKVIVTSYVFQNGQIRTDRLQELLKKTGKDHLVLDLSCRAAVTEEGKREYRIVTDRWQKFTHLILCPQVLDELSKSCSEFLIHAADVEGKAAGIELPLVRLLGDWQGIPITYAGGVGTYDHLRQLKTEGKDRLDVTIGSALSLFGGDLSLQKILEMI